MTHAKNHNHYWPTPSPTTQTPDPQPNHKPRPTTQTLNPTKKKERRKREKRWCLGLNREERREKREERREKGAKKEEREKNWRTELVEREISGWNKIYIYIFLEYCYSTILTLELYCSTIAKKFAIVGFTIFWCTHFWAMKYQKGLRYGINILQC